MIRFFTGHPTAANLLMIVALVAGILALPNLQLETFPRISTKTVQITTSYPGASPSDVERSICRRIEDALDGVQNLNELTCEARENRAIVVAEMEEGSDIEQFFSDIDSEVSAINDFPSAVEDPVVEQLGRTDFVVSLAITGIEDRNALKAYAETVKDRMQRFGGIPQIEVTGFSDKQFRIEIDDMTARELGLSIDDIADLVAIQNTDLPGGDVITENGVTSLRFADERETVNAYASLVVASSAMGGQITLGDIATITERFEDDEVEMRLNGQTAAVLDIYKTTKDDTLTVMERVNLFLEEERSRATPGIAFTIISDSSVALRDRLTMLVENSFQGILLVVGATWLFFGFRQAFWIAMGLPVSFLGAMALMPFLGVTINMLSMVGLLIVVGIIMDDAIVISENIATKRSQGLKGLEAAVAGTLQVLPGVVSSFLTTLAVFGALAFISGDLGELLRIIPIVMILVLAVSLVEAFLILPNHLSHTGSEKPGAVTRAAEGLVAWLRDHVVGPCSEFAVQYRYFTFGVSVMLFLGTLALIAGGIVKFEAFPSVEENQIQARIELSANARLEDTQSVVAEVVEALERVNGQLSSGVTTGGALVENVLVSYNENQDAGTRGPHLATINVDIAESEERTVNNPEILRLWRDEVPSDLDVRRIIIADASVGPAGRAIEIRLSHDDLDVLKQASLDLRTWFSQFVGVYNLSDDLQVGKPELAISMRDGAGGLGLNAQEIADQIRAGFNGVIADEVQVGDESFEVDVRLSSANRDSLGDLDQFSIQTASGERVPLSEVAVITPERGYTRINRVNRIPTVTITGDVETDIVNAQELVNLAGDEILPQLVERYPGLVSNTEGQNAEGAETQASMLQSLVIGLMIVFVLLSFQFRSYAEPLVVMILIPFALIGAVLGHVIMGLDFTLPSTLGFISLAGIVVNDSILLVTFIKSEHAPGVTSVAEAAPVGAKARFRAILLTSVTTIAGVLPLLFETSVQAQILIPLVTSIAFGLLSTTLMLMFLVPAFYTILDDFGLTSLAAERRAAAKQPDTYLEPKATAEPAE